MKRILAVLLAAVLLLALCGCGNNGPSVTSASELYGRRVGVLSGSVAGGSKALKDCAGAIYEYASADELLAAMHDKEVECAVLEHSFADALNKKSPKVKMLDDPYIDETYSFIAAKENAALIEDINEALAAMTEDGTLQDIIDGYTALSGYQYEPAFTADQAAITLLVRADNSPYSFQAGNGYRGLDVDIAAAVCDRLGIGLDVRVLKEGDDPVELIKAGEGEIAMGMVKTEESAKLVDFSEPYFTSTQMILVRK